MRNRILFHLDRLNDQQNTRCVHPSLPYARLCAARQLQKNRLAGGRPATIKRGLQWKAGDSILKLHAEKQPPSDRWALLIGCAVALAINGLAVAVCVLLN
jgi:hypothetical protein